MKINKKLLSIVAISAIALPLALPATAQAAATLTVNDTTISIDENSPFNSDDEPYQSSYSDFSNGKEVKTVLPADADYVPNTAKIQKYLEGYINEFRHINGLSAVNWDQDSSINSFINKRVGQLDTVTAKNLSHDGYKKDKNKPQVSENIVCASDGINSDQETAYYLFAEWYSEIDQNEADRGHLYNMLQESDSGSLRVSYTTDGYIYAVGQNGSSHHISYQNIKKMPTHTFIYK